MIKSLKILPLLLVMLASAVAHGAVQFVQAAQAESGGASVAVTINLTAGDTVVVIGSAFTAATVGNTAVTDDKSDTYNFVAQKTGGSCAQGGFYAMNVAGGTTTITFAAPHTDCGIDVLVYRGVASVSALDGHNEANGSSNAPASGSITTAGSSDVIVSAAAEDVNNVTWTGPNTWNLRTNQGNSLHIAHATADLIAQPAGTYSATWGMSSSFTWTALILGLKSSNVSFTETYLMPSYNGGTTTAHLVNNNGGTWTGSETLTASGVASWSVASKVLVDSTHYTVTLNCPSSGDTMGRLSISDGTNSATVTVGVGTALMLADWDPTSGVTQGTGTRVTQWVDKFAGNVASQATVGLQPFLTTDLYGNTVVESPLMDPNSGPPVTNNNGQYLSIANTLSMDYGNSAVFVVFERARAYSGNMPLFSSGANAILQVDGQDGPGLLRAFTTFSSTVNNPLGPNICGQNTVGGVVTFYNGYSQDVDNSHASFGTGTSTGGTIGGTATLGQFARILVFKNLGTADVQNVIGYLQTKYSLPTSYNKQMLMDGHSYGGHGTTHVGTVMNLLTYYLRGNGWKVYDYWVDGKLFSGAVNPDSLYNGALSRNVFLVWLGENEMVGGANTPAATYNAAKTYATARVTAGWEYWEFTCIGGDNVTDANSNSYSALLRGGGGNGNGLVVDSGIRGLIDVNATDLGTADVNDHTLFDTGGTDHPTLAGYTVAAVAATPMFLMTSVTPTPGSPGATSVPLSWSAVTGGNGTINYQIQKSLHGANTWSNAGSSTTATSATVSGLTASTSYDFRIVATDSGTSGFTTHTVPTFNTTGGTANATTTAQSNGKGNNHIGIDLGLGISAVIPRVPYSDVIGRMGWTTTRSGGLKRESVTR